MDNLAEKKKCYKYAIEYCLAIKKEQNLAFATKWMQLWTIALKYNHHMIYDN